MASLPAIPIESVVHDAFRDLAQTIFDQHGIVVQSVSFEWLDASSCDRTRMVVTDISTHTLTKR